MAIATDAFSGGDNGGSVNTLTLAHTCTGSNLGLLVIIGTGEVPSTVTYAGSGMTLIGNVTGVRIASIWYLNGPSAGTNNIVATVGSNQLILGVGASYSGVNSSGQPESNTINSAAFTATFTLSVTTITDNAWTVFLADQYTGGTGVASGTGATLRWTNSGASGGQVGILDSAAVVHPAGSNSMTASGGVAGSIWAGGIVSLAPAGGGGGGTSHNALTLLGVG